MTTTVVVAAVVAAAVCLALGVWSAVQVLPKQKAVLAAMTPPEVQAPGSPPGPIANQSASSAAIDSVAKLAAALKDLDRVAQMTTLALGFLAVGAVAAGVDAISSAVG
jgi:hypothetical protein